MMKTHSSIFSDFVFLAEGPSSPSSSDETSRFFPLLLLSGTFELTAGEETSSAGNCLKSTSFEASNKFSGIISNFFWGGKILK